MTQGVAKAYAGDGRTGVAGYGRGAEANRAFVVFLIVEHTAQLHIEPEILRVDILGVPQNSERGVGVLYPQEGAGQDQERRRVLSPNVDRLGQPA